ncbi:threonine/serine exporter family protein [Streptomyces cavourensis]|nr:threonine/serine exporter family protein [Streptomyces cavourensis]
MTVDVTARTIQAQYAPPGERPLTMMMETGSEDSRDLRQLGDLSALTHRVLDEGLRPLDAERELTRIISLKGYWPWWTKVLGGALLAAMLCVLASGTPKAAVVAPVVFLVGNRFGWALSTSGLPSFYVTGLQTAAVIGLTMVLADAHALSGGEAASVAAANMVLLLPILSVVSLAEDAISGFRAMAAGRLISVGMFLAAMVGGVSLVGFLLRDADVDARNTAFRALPLVLSLVTSAVGALGNAVFMGGPPRLLPWAMGAGVLAGLVNGLLHQELGLATPPADYVNAHGSGTKQNDRHETAALKKSLGDHAYRTPVSSIKSMVGHSLGAIGSIEIAASVLAMEHHVVPPTANLHTPDPECDLDYVPLTAREHRTDTVLTVGSGFGGFQSAMVLARPERNRP